MMVRFFSSAALAAAALGLAACGGGDGGNLNEAAAANQNISLPKVDPPANGDWTQTVQETPEGGYRMGNPDAQVKLVEYASISCHVCAEFSEAGHQALTQNYVKSGQVSWEYRPFMLFPTDPGLFALLRCQGPQPFFANAEQLYATQDEWSARIRSLSPTEQQALSAMPPQQQAGALVKALRLDAFFRQRGMPQAQIDQCLADQSGLQRLVAIQQVGTNDGVTGTPTFFINGNRANVTAWPAVEARLREALGQ